MVRVVRLEWVTVSAPMVSQTAGDSCRQLHRESKLQRQCFQTAGLQMSQWRPSRSVEQEPMGLIVGHSWSACLNSVKSPRQTEATHSLCVTRCLPDQSVQSRAATLDTGSIMSLFGLCLEDLPQMKKTIYPALMSARKFVKCTFLWQSGWPANARPGLNG